MSQAKSEQEQLNSSLLPQSIVGTTPHMVGQPQVAAAVLVLGVSINDPTGRVQKLSRQVLRIAILILIVSVASSASTMMNGSSYGAAGVCVPLALFFCAFGGIKRRRKDLLCCFSGWSLFFSIVVSAYIVILALVYVMLHSIGSNYTCHSTLAETCQCCETNGSTDDDFFTPTPSPARVDDDQSNPGSYCVAISSSMFSMTCSADALSTLASYVLVIIVTCTFQVIFWCCAFCKGCALQKESYFNNNLAEPTFAPQGQAVMVSQHQPAVVYQAPVVAQAVPSYAPVMAQAYQSQAVALPVMAQAV
jgi:hypothetical protein